MTWSPAAQRTLAAGRRRIALARLCASEPRPLRVPSRIRPDAYVIVHRSTVRQGWWQASYFDAGGAAGDTDGPDWARVLKNASECYLCEWTLAAYR